MPGLDLPATSTLADVFPSPLSSREQRKKGSLPAFSASRMYPYASIQEDAKSKAQKLSKEAQAEFEKASKAAQKKAGHIELYSAKYYAACTVGGLFACVSTPQVSLDTPPPQTSPSKPII